MYCLDICSICFIKEKDLKNLFDKENNELTYYDKLITTIPEMVNEEKKSTKLICNQCTRKIEDIYNFRQKCLKSKHLFKDYVNQLHTVSDVIGDVKIHIIDINLKDNDYVNNEKNIKLEGKTDVEKYQIDEKIGFELLPTEIIKTELIDNDEHTELPETESRGYQEAYTNFPYTYDNLRQNPELEILAWNNPIIAETLYEPYNQAQFPIEPTPKGIYTCNVCYRQFNYKSNLQKHELTHTGKMPYTCEICNAGFRLKNNYNEHREKNTCGEIVSQQRELKSHMAAHKETYNCNFCEKTYTSKLGLEKHIRIHMGFKPYVCNVCNKRFNCPSHLKVHCRIHTGEKPYQCSFCYKSFADNSNLTKHLAKYHS